MMRSTIDSSMRVKPFRHETRISHTRRGLVNEWLASHQFDCFNENRTCLLPLPWARSLLAGRKMATTAAKHATVIERVEFL